MTSVPEGGGLGFHVMGHGDARHGAFVRATRVDRVRALPWLSLRSPGRVDVVYERAQLPPGVVEASVRPPGARARSGNAEVKHDSVLSSTLTASAAVAIAYAVNAGMMWCSFFGLLSVLHARTQNAEKLWATAADDSTWWRELRSAFFYSWIYSLLLIDGVKIVCLTLTSKAALAALGLNKSAASPAVSGSVGGKSKKVAAEASRKVVRRLHKVLEFFS